MTPPTAQPPADSPVSASFGVTVGAAAALWDIPHDELEAAARTGRLPPHLCSLAGDGWMCAADGDPDEARRGARSAALHLPRVDPDVAPLTAAWADDEAGTGNGIPLGDIVEWCWSARPGAQQADREQFAWWCAHHPPGKPADCARRWESLTAWYEMLYESGVPTAMPHTGTRVGVIVAAE